MTVQAQLRELIALADAFLAGSEQLEPGDETATQAVEAYVASRTEIFERMVAAGGPTDAHRADVQTLLARDDDVRSRISGAAARTRGHIDKLRNGRRALRGYRAPESAPRPVAIKG